MPATHPTPPWYTTLLSNSTIPTFPIPIESHNKPAHPNLTPVISDARLHPALEAALHLANGDLYSAHFLVRKAQGGAKELDWGHAILHRLEGDMGNAKCWYTDLSNLQKSTIYIRFTSSLPSGITPYKYVDLCHFYHLRAQGSSNVAQQVHETTTKYEKIPRDQSFTLRELQSFESGDATPPLSEEDTRELAIREIRTMVDGLAEEYGWSELSMEESVSAFKDQSGANDDDKVKHDGQGMILGGGSRTF